MHRFEVELWSFSHHWESGRVLLLSDTVIRISSSYDIYTILTLEEPQQDCSSFR